jgi:N6-L-threonylcarbamoyladenine synthase
MIAYAGYRRLQAGQSESLSIKVQPRWSLEELPGAGGA